MASSLPAMVLSFIFIVFGVVLLRGGGVAGMEPVRIDEHQPLSRIALHRMGRNLMSGVTISASPSILGKNGEILDYATVTFHKPVGAHYGDWVGVFSPANFNGSLCTEDLQDEFYKSIPPYICSSPTKFQFANYSSPNYANTGVGSLKFKLLNQRHDIAFGFFSGGLENPILEAISAPIEFKYPKAPILARLAIGKTWNEMTVTWTSGYHFDEAIPVVVWGPTTMRTKQKTHAFTLSFRREDTCGAPARTHGYRDPGYIHTAHLKDLWPRTKYYYKMGHLLKNGKYVWGKPNHFTSSPFPGQESMQRIVMFGDLGVQMDDGSQFFFKNAPASANTTNLLAKDIDNIDMVFLIGDITYANGYMSEWDWFVHQVEPIASRVPWMHASGNHERNWPGTGSFYESLDSGGECGVLSETYFNMPTTNKDKNWYSVSYGMFHFCVLDSELEWRAGSEQHKWLETCLASVDRRTQPWLIVTGHRVLGYSSADEYAAQGTFGEPMAREALESLYQKYKVDIAMFGHVHQYERTCPVYENQCVSNEQNHFSGTFNATIFIVAGGGGAALHPFTTIPTNWSLKRDHDYGFTKLTAFNRSSLLFEYKHSADGKVVDRFTIYRERPDVLGCDQTKIHHCPHITLADQP